jgi:hypothetical protein
VDRFRPRHGYANIVSTICLFLLLGGGAWAATQLPKGSVGTPQLKNGAVTGAKVKNDSLTGADIQAATIGKVPQASAADSATNAAHATSADSAGHADTAGSAGHATSADAATRAGDAATLDGLPSSALLSADRVRRISYEGHWESETPGLRTILAVGPLTLAAQCAHSEEGTVHTRVQLFATGPAGATMDYGQMVAAASKTGVYTLDPTTPTQVEVLASTDTESFNAFVTFVYRDSVRTISIPLDIDVTSASDACRVTGTALVAE